MASVKIFYEKSKDISCVKENKSADELFFGNNLTLVEATDFLKKHNVSTIFEFKGKNFYFKNKPFSKALDIFDVCKEIKRIDHYKELLTYFNDFTLDDATRFLKKYNVKNMFEFKDGQFNYKKLKCMYNAFDVLAELRAQGIIPSHKMDDIEADRFLNFFGIIEKFEYCNETYHFFYKNCDASRFKNRGFYYLGVLSILKQEIHCKVDDIFFKDNSELTLIDAKKFLKDFLATDIFEFDDKKKMFYLKDKSSSFGFDILQVLFELKLQDVYKDNSIYLKNELTLYDAQTFLSFYNYHEFKFNDKKKMFYLRDKSSLFGYDILQVLYEIKRKDKDHWQFMRRLNSCNIVINKYE